MNRKELIDRLSEKTETTKKEADQFLRAFMETVEEELRGGNTISLVGFGTFKVADRKARTAKNPQTKATIQIPAKKVPVFKFSKSLKGF